MGKIIWLASFPKSGNTWMRAFLHNLLMNPEKPVYINDLDTFCRSESAAVFYRPLEPKPLEEWTIEDVARLRPRVHESLTDLSPDDVFIKTHCALAKDHGHPTVNLDVTAGAIYIVRNPLDVTLSFAKHTGTTINRAIGTMARADFRTDTDARNVQEFRGSWSQHVASWTAKPSPTLHVLRYEDMLEKPTETFGRLARFLGLDPPHARLQSAINMSSFEVLREQERRWGFRERSRHTEMFFGTGKAGQWKDALTPLQIATVADAHRQQMMRFGYVPSGF